MEDSIEILEGSFYGEELQKAMKEDNIFHLGSILCKTKKGKDTFLLVKWKGYPKKFNGLVDKNNMKDL